MKAMILAAGLGTRLRPLTDTRPKALVEINGCTLLEITLTRLRAYGVTEAIINVHHFTDMVVQYLKSKNNFGMRLEISREDDQLLDTGGGLKKASWFFQEDPAHLEEPFLLHNVDVISTIDLAAMLRFHIEHQAQATLAVQTRESSRQLLFDDQLQLSGRRINNRDTLVDNASSVDASASAQATIDASANAKVCHSEHSEESAFSSHSPLATSHSPLTQSQTPSSLLSLAFSGIHILSPRLLPLFTETGPFSIIDSYLRLSSQGQKILAFRHDNSYWRDLGKPADLAQAARDLQQGVFL
ncbi:MAG TPA: nucleotidyltransferase family protein [Candidatus Acidoferrum sp.]